MKKTEVLTIIGFVVGIGMMFFGMGSSLDLFFDIPSLAITLGGCIGVIAIITPSHVLKKFGVLVGQALKESTESKTAIIVQFSELAVKARKEGLLSLEDAINNLDDKFLKKGLQMVVDGIEPDSIKEILELDISALETRHAENANMFAMLGVYGPSMGMLGTLIGLIQMLANLTDATTIAVGMGKALITTYYGSLIANLFGSPISQNLIAKTKMEVNIKEMMIEGILSIQAGVNPRIIEQKLTCYLSPAEREEYLKNNSDSSEGAA